MKRIRLALAAALVLALGVTGVALGVSGERELEVRLSEFKVDAPTTVASGPNSLVIRNSGRVDHDLVVVRTNTAAGKLPIGLNGVAPQLAGKIVYGEPHSAHAHGKDYVPRHHVASGTSKKVTLDLAPGRYVLLCSLPRHYEQGQRAALRVR